MEKTERWKSMRARGMDDEEMKHNEMDETAWIRSGWTRGCSRTSVTRMICTTTSRTRMARGGDGLGRGGKSKLVEIKTGFARKRWWMGRWIRMGQNGPAGGQGHRRLGRKG